MVRPGGQLADVRPGGRFASGDDLVCERLDVVETVACAQCEQSLRTDLTTGHLCVQVAGHVIRLPNVRHDEVPHVGVALSGNHQPHDGDPQSLFEHVTPAGADAVAADVGVVDRRSEERDDPAVAEDRVQHRDVEQLAGRLVRVVGDEHVTLDEGVGRVHVEDRRCSPRERVDVPGGARDGLGDHPAASVEDGVGQVARLTHDRRECGPLQSAGLLVDGGDQALPQHFEFDRIEAHYMLPSVVAVRTAIIDPSVATSAVHPGRMTVVVSRSSTIAGPTSRWPTPRSSRR